MSGKSTSIRIMFVGLISPTVPLALSGENMERSLWSSKSSPQI